LGQIDASSGPKRARTSAPAYAGEPPGPGLSSVIGTSSNITGTYSPGQPVLAMWAGKWLHSQYVGAEDGGGELHAVKERGCTKGLVWVVTCGEIKSA
jgi:hypothetical protein